MNSELISSDVVDIGPPWYWTAWTQRFDALDGYNPTPQRVDHALTTLPRILDAQIQHNQTRSDRNATDPDLVRLGELLDDGLASIDMRLDGLMPTLADISHNTVRAYLERFNRPDLALPWTASPPPKVVDYVTDWWIGGSVLPGISKTLLTWLHETMHLHPEYAERVPFFLHLCEHYIHADVSVRYTLLLSISTAGKRAALPALRRISTSPDLPQDIRELAHISIGTKILSNPPIGVVNFQPPPRPFEIRQYTATSPEPPPPRTRQAPPQQRP